MFVEPAEPPVDRHCYAAVVGAEQALELSSAFVTAGLRRSERVTLVGLTSQRAAALLTRLREDDAEPAGALRVRQLTLLNESTSRSLYAMSTRQITEHMLQ